MTTLAEERFYTSRELEKKLGMPPGELAKRRYTGRPAPPHIRISQGTIRYAESDVVKWLEANRSDRSSKGKTSKK